MTEKKVVLAVLLIITGIASRALGKVVPNTELITTITLVTTSYLGLRWSIGIIVGILAVSDMILGNSSIFLFTWSAFIFLAWGGRFWLTKQKKGVRLVIQATALGVTGSIWFFIWTNFGVWLLDRWNMYPKTIAGLIDAYILALPFFRNNLIGNIIFVPAVFTLIETARLVVFPRKEVLSIIEKQIKTFI